MKFLGLQLDNHLNWKDHIELIPKLSVVHIYNINTLKLIYNAHFHSVIKYEIIVWGNSTNSGRSTLYKRKSSELWLVHNPEIHAEICLNN